MNASRPIQAKIKSETGFSVVASKAWYMVAMIIHRVQRRKIETRMMNAGETVERVGARVTSAVVVWPSGVGVGVMMADVCRYRRRTR